MKHLGKNWLTSGWMDFEYKKYLVLAYLQHVREHFGKTELYPPLGELVQHYNDLRVLLDEYSKFSAQFSKELKGIDMSNHRLIYAEFLQDKESLKTLQEIIDFALPEFKAALDEGKGIYDLIEGQLEFEEIGITPLYKDEGLLMLHDESREVHIFRYELSRIIRGTDSFRSLKTEFLAQESRSVINTIEQLKRNSMKWVRDLQHPATYSIFSGLKLPLGSTFLPLAKRLLIRELSQGAA